jgi:DNA-binding MarR family transcriptional regulator
LDTLDPILHQPLRTQLAAFLAGCDEATFNELKRRLEVSDGNLDSHLKKLIAAGYVAVRKDSGEGRPQSCYSLTPDGREALQRYVAALQRLLPLSAPATPASQSAIVLKPRLQG